MHSARLAASVLALAALLAGCTASPAAPTVTPTATDIPLGDSGTASESEVFTPVIARVTAPPVAAPMTDGRVHLAYELILSNILSQSVTLDAVEVTGDGDELLSLSGDDLGPWMKVYGATDATQEMGPGQSALVWLDVVVDSMDAVPTTLEHNVTISPEEAVEPIFGTPMTETVAAVTPVTTAPITIGPPLRGAGWLDGNSCCDVTPHRAAINSINGSLWAPERFAIDYVQLDAEGRIFDGPIDELSSYAYYGADILAVGDGPIVGMVWDYPTQTPGANPTGLPLDEYGGNHIVQDLGGGHYAFYAHLQPGNPEGLEVGQQLTKGQTIALLGNTGNTDGPHLHFHIMDSPLPLGSNGLPFLIDSFDLAGRIPSTDDLLGCAQTSEACTVETAGSGPMTDLSPLYLDVMDYPE